MLYCLSKELMALIYAKVAEWQTHYFEVVASNIVWVQVPFFAP